MKDLINKIHLGDCMDYMRDMPDNSIDLVLTDPPYGINAAINGGIGGGSKRGKVKDCKPSNWDEEIPTKELFNEIFRVSKNQIIWGGNYFISHLKNTRCMITWYKRDGLPERSFADSELAWTSFDKNSKVYNLRWDGFIRDSNDTKELHPTQKPTELFKKCLNDFIKKGIVLDCFSGSGTTALACHDLGLDFICIEKDEDYHAASVKRLEEHKRQGRLF